jgi:predicted nucleic acid-binding protein
MNGRFFLDTNVFVYTFDSAAPMKAKKATDLIRKAANSGEGIVSFQVVQEFFNVALRRFSQPMSIAEAEQYLITVFRPLLAVHSSPAIYLEALRIAAKHRLAWYDAVIVASAVEGECDTLYSEDLQHGAEIDGVRVKDPFI